MKRDSVTSLAYNNLFRSFITTTCMLMLNLMHGIFENFLRQLLKISIQMKLIVLNKIIYKDKKDTKIPRSFASRTVR